MKKDLIFFVMLTLLSVSYSMDCDYQGAVENFDEMIGVSSIMQESKIVNLPLDDLEDEAAIYRRVSPEIISGEFKGLIQKNTYLFSNCRILKAVAQKISADTHKEYSTVSYAVRENGKLQAACAGTKGMYESDASNGFVINTDCECYDADGNRSNFDEKMGCLLPDQYDEITRRYRSSQHDCNYEKIVNEFDTMLGIFDIMKSSKIVKLKHDGLDKDEALFRRTSKEIKSGKFKGMIQKNTYFFQGCKISKVGSQKLYANSGKEFVSASYFVRANGKLQAACADLGELYTILPYNGQIVPNTGCICYDSDGVRTDYDKKMGCLLPSQYLELVNRSRTGNLRQRIESGFGN